MSPDMWEPKSITLVAHLSPSQTVTLKLICLSIELELLPATGQSQWVVKVEDARGLTAADWHCLSFIDSEGMNRQCPIHSVQEVKPGDDSEIVVRSFFIGHRPCRVHAAATVTPTTVPTYPSSFWLSWLRSNSSR
jgi:hypothetical protein